MNKLKTLGTVIILLLVIPACKGNNTKIKKPIYDNIQIDISQKNDQSSDLTTTCIDFPLYEKVKGKPIRLVEYNLYRYNENPLKINANFEFNDYRISDDGYITTRITGFDSHVAHEYSAVAEEVHRYQYALKKVLHSIEIDTLEKTNQQLVRKHQIDISTANSKATEIYETDNRTTKKEYKYDKCKLESVKEFLNGDLFNLKKYTNSDTETTYYYNNKPTRTESSSSKTVSTDAIGNWTFQTKTLNNEKHLTFRIFEYSTEHPDTDDVEQLVKRIHNCMSTTGLECLKVNALFNRRDIMMISAQNVRYRKFADFLPTHGTPEFDNVLNKYLNDIQSQLDWENSKITDYSCKTPENTYGIDTCIAEITFNDNTKDYRIKHLNFFKVQGKWIWVLEPLGLWREFAN